MNYKLILKLAGSMLVTEALFMLVPFVVSLIYGGGDHWAFLLSILVVAGAGVLLSLLKPKNKTFRTWDAYAAATVSWFLLSVFGALPFIISGCFSSITDCIFESVSGFTTTGATVLTDIELLPKGILFWRSLSQWIGGMGVLMFVMAAASTMHASSVNLLRAESTGPSPDKIVPKIRETAKITCLIYLSMTALLVILLCVYGLPVYDSLITSFSTAGTGGFSNMNASISAYGNTAAEIIITVFMFLFGISFTLYFMLLNRKFRKFFMDEELRLYFVITAAAIAVVTINVYASGLYGSISESLRHSSFQISSVISTTTFSTVDYQYWPTLSKVILVTLMIFGGCAGSTSGGTKIMRVLLMAKAARIELSRLFRPGVIKTVTVNGKKIGADLVSRSALFFFVYSAIFLVAAALVSIEGKDIVSSTTAVIAALSNIGPGLEIISPSGNYSVFTPFSKIVLSFCMVAGRLEFFPVLVFFSPSIWKKGLMK